MAKQFSPNAIRPTDDWTIDTRNGLPYSGLTIQNYIKERIGQSVGAAYFDQSSFILYFFNTVEDRDIFEEDHSRTDLVVSSTPLTFSSDMYRIAVTNNLPSYDIQVATNQETFEISLDFDVQHKTITDTEWVSTGEGVIAKAYIDVGSTGNYVLIPNSTKTLVAHTTYILDIRPYLSVGSNRVKVNFVSESDDNVTANAVYSITLSEMYIELSDNRWYNAIVEGELTNYQLGGFKIVGALSKTLNIDILRGKSVVKRFVKDVGTGSFISPPYYYDAEKGLNLSGLESGVYICDAYLKSGSLESLHVTYNFMYVAAGDKLSAQLVCINDVIPVAHNYSTEKLCDYAIYNAGSTTGEPWIKIQLVTGSTPGKTDNNPYPGTTVGEKHELQYNIEWSTSETVDIWILLEISLGESSQVQQIPIDNSKIYPAADGATFYFNAASRTNNDVNRDKILNEAANPTTELSATWTNMAWVDGIDGWTTDPDGRRALLIPAGSTCTIPYKIMTGSNITFELCFRTANVSDYNENIITISENPLVPGFQGIRIRPTDITIHSNADQDASKDVNRSKSFEDETTNHILLTIQNNFSNIQNDNLTTLYINGCKALEFDYATGTIWENNGNMVIGSSSADVYIYSCRAYTDQNRPGQALGVAAAEQNYINSLQTREEREATKTLFDSILDPNNANISQQITYEKVLNSKGNYNFFVIEMKDGATVPSRANNWGKKQTGYSDIEMHFGKHPEWDFKIFDVETAGQGTTSMDYYRWNLRWRVDKNHATTEHPKKNALIAYYDAPTVTVDGKKTFNMQTPEVRSSVWFDGGADSRSTAQHPALQRITAKINFASSMQSHKIGATRAFTDLHDAIGLENEAQRYARNNNLPSPTVAVYQYPAFGFSRTISQTGVPTYEYIGLFTIGPDKGDKPTFGYDLGNIKSNLITLEGTDHARKMAQFQYPWDTDEVAYLASNECINIVLGGDKYDDAWEVSNCYGKSTDEMTDQQDIQDILISQFKPAYEVAWNNSTLIFPISLDDPTYGDTTAAGVLANINADLTNFRSRAYNDRFTVADMEFWIEGEYTLYHYDVTTDETKGTPKYVPGLNLRAQFPEVDTSLTLDEQNEWFKTKRRERFFTQAPSYWDIQDSAYHFAFCLMIGATDNFAKNSYPYKMAPLANGGRWKWRQDDLDTIFDTDNRGTDSKPYYIEFEDVDNGSVVFAGSTSVFWNLLFETFWEDYDVYKGIRSIGKDIVYKMADIGGGGNTFTGVVNFFKKYFWDNAQYYFPSSGYNRDANWKYELAWLNNGQAVDPLTQSLGRHIESEHLWCTRRAIYVMSLFKAGAFESSSDTVLGQITFRPYSLPDFTVTPMLWMYPAFSHGTDSPVNTSRTEAGHSHTFVGPFSTEGQTACYIQASNYLSDVGDWKDIQLGAQYVQNVDVVGAKLRNFKIGDENEEVTTNIPSVTFNNTKCLEQIDARNTYSLTGALDVTNCTRLKRLYLEGTRITQVNLPTGSKINELHLSDSTNTLLLKNLKFLTGLQMPSDVSQIRTLQIENCAYQDAIEVLNQLFDADDAALQYIRLIWDGNTQVTAGEVTTLGHIVKNEKKDGSYMNYQGINAQGEYEGRPVVEGTVEITDGIFMDDFETLDITQIEDYDTTRKKGLSAAYGTLYVIYNPNRIYISFADPEVSRIANANWGDGTGVTIARAQAYTDNFRPGSASDSSIYPNFQGKSNIYHFDEMRYFTGCTFIYGNANQGTGAFYSCANLETVILPPTVTSVHNSSFRSCPKLRSIGSPEELINLKTIESRAFNNCGFEAIDFPSVTSIGYIAFSANPNLTTVNLPSIVTLGNGTSQSGGVFTNDAALKTVTLGPNLNLIGSYAFQNCTGLETVNGLGYASTINERAFYGCTKLQSNPSGENLTSVGNYGFYNCKAITGPLNIPNATTLDYQAFCECSGLTGLTAPNVITIGQSAFQNCTGLKGGLNLTSATTIAQGAFQGCTGLDGELSLPVVVTIGSNAFTGNSGLTTGENGLSLPQLTTLGTYAFQNCSGLTGELSIPNIASIPAFAFERCSGLTSLSLPVVNTIGQSAFKNCTGLTGTLSLPEVITISGGESFYGCTGLTSLDMPKATTIGGYSFQNCTGLTGTLSLPEATSLGYQAFFQCSEITGLSLPSLVSVDISCFNSCSSITGEISLPSTVTSLGSSAFAGCSGIQSVDLNGAEVEISNGLFSGCTSLTEVKHGQNITGEVGNNSFRNCTSLTTIDLGKATSIGGSYSTSSGNSGAFYGCSNLTNITLPSTLTEIKPRAFYGCTNLATVDFNGAGVQIDNLVFNDDTNLTTVSNTQNVSAVGNGAFTGTRLSSFDLSGCTTIGGNMKGGSGSDYTSAGPFQNLITLNNVNLGSIATTIAANSFSGCTNMPGIVNYPGLISIGAAAFQETAITQIQSLGQVSNIPNATFRNCTSLTTANIPDSVTKIQLSAFEGDTALTTVNFSDTQTMVGGNCFMNCTSLVNVNNAHISGWGQGDNTDAYQAFKGCTSLVNLDFSESTFTYIQNPADINQGAFRGCTSLETVTLPTTCTSIGTAAFYGCTSLEHIYGGTIQTIYGNAFHGCTNLETVDLTNAVTLSNTAFYGSGLMGDANGDLYMPNLTTLSNGNDGAFQGTRIRRITSLGSITNTPEGSSGWVRGTFRNCTSLTSVVLPNTITSLGQGTFDGCTNLVNINFPDSLTTISTTVFQGCTNLIGGPLVLPEVTSIGVSAFKACTSITSLSAPKLTTITYWGSGGVNYGGFQNCTGLRTVTLSDCMTNIGQGAFNGCTNLQYVIIPTEIPPTLGAANAFTNPTTYPIYVPYGCGAAYKAATNWSSLANRIFELDENGNIPQE